MSAICARCECEYSVRPDEDATRFCDECAHQLTEYLVGENEQLRAQVASLTAEVERKQAALESVIAVWDRQRGRVFESMGSDNPRPQAIGDAMDAARRAVLPVGGGG